MDDGTHSVLCSDLGDVIAQLFDISLDLTARTDQEPASSERIEPVVKAVNGAVEELRVVLSLLGRLEQLPGAQPVELRFPSLDVLADEARHNHPVIPDAILLRIEQVVSTAGAAASHPRPKGGS